MVDADSRTNPITGFTVMTDPDFDDVDLLKRISRGDHQAFRRFFLRHYRFCIQYAYRIVQDPAGAEDVVQDVFLSVWTGAARFQASRARAVTWLRTIVHHRAVDHIRRAAKEKSTGVGSLQDLAASATGVAASNPFQEVWTADAVLSALQAVNELPRRQHELIVLLPTFAATPSPRSPRPLGFRWVRSKLVRSRRFARYGSRLAT
nr:sigma-70 family RNA polymerase sigma factor [Fodinicola feengrottensis]